MVKKINKFLIISEAIVLLSAGMLTVSGMVPASIGDFVWNDLNVNGIQDPGELGLSGVTVNLCDEGENYLASTTTDANGYYIFDELVSGKYFVEFIRPGGYEFSPQDQGSDDTVDSDADPVTGRTICTILESGQNDLTWDAGMYILGCLKVTKIVNWNGVDPIARQTFEICITGPSYTDGDCKTFTYPDEDDLIQVWCNLIPGDYTISETDPGDMWVVHGDGVTVSIPTDGSSASAEITNTYKVPEGCAHTQGYWKTHSEYGPAPYDNTWAELPDGADTEFFGTGHTYYEILNMNSRGGNAYIILAHQYIAAELNGLNNDDSLPSHITDIMGDAELLLIDYQSSLEIPKKNPDRSYAITLAGELDGFNNGYFPGWPHCDDNDDD
jgi:uncharacterized protein YaiE (UPF0345 family)